MIPNSRDFRIWDIADSRELILPRFGLQEPAALAASTVGTLGSPFAPAGLLAASNLTPGRTFTVYPDSCQFAGFLGSDELLLLHHQRYRVWNCRTGQEWSASPAGLQGSGSSMRLPGFSEPRP